MRASPRRAAPCVPQTISPSNQSQLIETPPCLPGGRAHGQLTAPSMCRGNPRVYSRHGSDEHDGFIRFRRLFSTPGRRWSSRARSDLLPKFQPSFENIPRAGKQRHWHPHSHSVAVGIYQCGYRNAPTRGYGTRPIGVVHVQSFVLARRTVRSTILSETVFHPCLCQSLTRCSPAEL